MGRTRKQPTGPPRQRSSFQWTDEIRMAMAEYLRANYELYKKSLGTLKKAEFLRNMIASLKLKCTFIQMKNGFRNFLKKYEEVKSQLGQSGFGVDPDKDATLDQGWVLKECPYYFILDEVMGTRPNLAPPFVLATAAPSSSSALMEIEGDDLSNPDPLDIDIEEDATSNLDGNDEHAAAASSPVIENEVEQNTTPTTEKPNDDASTSFYVRQTLNGIRPKRDDASKNPMSIFAAAMASKTEENVRIEREKLKMTQSHFAAELELKKEQNSIGLKKVDAQIALESKKLELEDRRLHDKAEERKHELERMRLQQEHELKKLELQLRLKRQVTPTEDQA